MERTELITLITKVAEGAEVTERRYHCFAAKGSTTRSEFYAAYQVGLNAAVTFSIDLDDWQASEIDGEMPTEVQYKNKRYIIQRVFEKYITAEVICDAGKNVV